MTCEGLEVLECVDPRRTPKFQSASRDLHGYHMFQKFAHWISIKAGTSTAFLLANILVLAWLISGPYFRYSDTWELVINTVTTIITFLMVFLIQSTQNRDT